MKPEELPILADKEKALQASKTCRLLYCSSTACVASGSGAVKDGLTRALKDNPAGKAAALAQTGCMGLCSHGPMVRVEHADRPSTLYEYVNGEAAARIVADELAGQAPAAIAPESAGRVLPQDIPFFTRQTKVVLARAGVIDPERIEDYIAHDGYTALTRALGMTPEQVCDEIQRSGLRGRGGAGYPTGLKWQHVRSAAGDKKYVVANGDEGDPGAYMDRTLMEADPHSVLEGMIIAAYAVGAQQGFFYVRAEYPLAVKRLERAIRMATRQGLLGKNILGSEFSFEVDIRIGAGAFVCGEETALMASIEGQRGLPRMRPPYPAQSGLWGCPTLINNVETFGTITAIVNKGADWFHGIGTEKSKGTKIFALTGKLNNTGLIEVPMGITLREIVFDIGGGVPEGRQFKAVQTGGPSGGCIPSQYLDMTVDYESLAKVGSIMGSGGMIVMDDSTDMVEVARFFMEFCMDESCGKCIPCRAGTAQMHHILTKIVEGKGGQQDLKQLEQLCDVVRNTSLCGLGQSAPNPVVSTLRYFRDEYEQKVK